MLSAGSWQSLIFDSGITFFKFKSKIKLCQERQKRRTLTGFSTCFYFSGTAHCSTSHSPSLSPIFFSTRRDVRILDKSLLAGSFSTYILPTVFNVLFQNGGILSFDLSTPFFAP